jgi:Spy/CpxP family protein refolding chaperone
MKLPVALLLLFAMAPASFAGDNKAQNQNPVAWGALSQNTGCVIFKEGHKTSGMFWGVAVTTKTVGKLTIIEAQNYTLDQDVILETQENMDDLMQRAQTDHVKFVKIPEKYSPRLLDRARAMCKQGQ